MVEGRLACGPSIHGLEGRNRLLLAVFGGGPWTGFESLLVGAHDIVPSWELAATHGQCACVSLR